VELSDLYEAKDWSDTSGPGCGQVDHHDDCLCDVDLEKHPVPPIDPNLNLSDVGYGAIANKVAGGPPRTPAEFYRWGAEYLGAFDAIKAAPHADEIERLVDQAKPKIGRSVGRNGWGAEVKRLIVLGLSFEAIANLLEVSMEAVVRSVTENGHVNIEAYVKLEALLRAGVASWGEAARITGLSADTCRCFATRMGFSSEAAEKRKAGGGDKYSAEQYEAVLLLRGEGKSYGEISKVTAVPRNAVIGICRRRGVRPEGEAA
jgi:hypothetical protein